MTDVGVALDRGKPLVECRPRLPDQLLRRSNSSRCVARIELALARIERRAAGRARSRAWCFASSLDWMERVSSERSTSARDVGRGPDDHVHPVALPQPLQAVEPLPRVPVLALDHVPRGERRAIPGERARARPRADRSWTDA